MGERMHLNLGLSTLRRVERQERILREDPGYHPRKWANFHQQKNMGVLNVQRLCLNGKRKYLCRDIVSTPQPMLRLANNHTRDGR